MIKQRITIANYADRSSFLWAAFADCLMAHGLQRMYTASWDTALEGADWAQLDALENDSVMLHVNYSSTHVELFAELKPKVFAYITIRKSSGTCAVTLAVQKEQDTQAAEVLGWLQTIYPQAPTDDPSVIRMKFWINSPQGAQGIMRNIAVPTWEDIEVNYAQETRQHLAGVMSDFTPAHGGQLLLWHGKPGTGKTFALRSLGLHWREWCKVECVVDPEVFFGDAYYMMSVLIDGRYEATQPEEADGKGRDPHSQWRLLILEDAGELLAEDARDRTGQGLSRLLNLADGLIGQGLNTLILVTTNEPLKKLHPAVARPGRCASEIEFQVFSAEEADLWLGQKGQEGPPTRGAQTLAQLYGQVEKFETAQGSETRAVGFNR